MNYAVATQLATWAWIAVYALVPVLMGILLIIQHRAVGVEISRRNWLPQTVDRGRPATWAYVLFLASFLLVGVYGWITATRTAHRSTVGFT